jgi:hypothetical protein
MLPPHCYLCLPWICRCASALLTSPWVHTHRVSLCRMRHLSSSLVYPVFAIYLRPLRAVLPPSGCLHFHIREVPVLYDFIAAGPRQAAVATPVAGGCRFVPVGALVLGPCALPLRCGPCLRWIFGCFSALFASRVCSTKPPNVAVPDASPAVRLRLPCLCRLIFLSRNVLSLSALFTFIFNGANAQYLHRYWSSPSGRCHICFRRLPSYLCGGLVLNLRRAASALLTLPSVDLRLLSPLLVSPCPGFWSRHFDPYSRHSGPVRSSTCLPP